MVVSFRDTLPPLHTHDGRDCSRILRTNGNHTHNRLHSRNTLVRIRKRMPDTYINFSVYHVCLFFLYSTYCPQVHPSSSIGAGLDGIASAVI